MNRQISKKLSFVVCILGLAAAVISFPSLPEEIPFHFSDGAPGNYMSKNFIFLIPLLQFFILISGSNRNMLPEQLNRLLSDSEYSWTVFGILVFTLLLELLIIAVVLTG